jgi:phosphatidylethanolamine-binding protein (PEBP) family uncharacterized protein
MRPKLLPAIAFALLPAPAFAFSIAVSWAGTKACFDPQSPAIALQDVPGGTATIAFHMQDEDAPNFRHGGGTVRYTGQTALAKGAFAYKGPCPPSPHRYRWTAQARDAAGKVLGRAETTLTFPPK